MRLDEDSAKLLAWRREINAPFFQDLTPVEARAAMTAARVAANVAPPAVKEVRDHSIVAPGRAIAARRYAPDSTADDKPGPALIFFHGGGWVIGDLESHDILCRQIANEYGGVVIAIEYRLAPESCFPAAVEDAEAATAWVFAHAAELGIDPSRVAVGGDSAGGNLAAVVALLARDRRLPPLAFQALLYPCTDLTLSRGSYDVAADGLPVTAATMTWFRDHYLAAEEQQVDWRASPLFAPSLRGVAPAYIVTAGFDPLADEGDAYVRRLRRSGVSVVHRHYPGQIHGFMTMGAMLPTAGQAIGELGVALRSSLSGARQ
jgi:acetyl esterase